MARDVAEALSPTELLGVPIAAENPVDLVRALEAGLPARALGQFKRRTELADTDLAELLRIGSRTLTRLKSPRTRRLPPEVSERLYALAALYAEAEQVFADHQTALDWLAAPPFAFAGKTPRELIASEIGREQVRALLRRIEHGQLA